MTIDPSLFAEAFNLLCGKELGQGIHRQVFLCRIDPSLVVKVEYDTDFFVGANASEWRWWDELQYAPAYARWLAPCKWISPNGRIMLQKRTTHIPSDRIPKLFPDWLIDTKWENFGMLDGKIVAHDYPTINSSLSKRLRKVNME
jgi:hypothetical protein